MNYSIERIEPPLYNGAVADEIIASLNDAIAERGRATLVLAGGSTPSAIYRLLSIPPRVQDLDWGKVTLYWGDERFVPATDGRSNFKMVHETVLNPLGTKAPRFFAVDTTLKSAADSATAYSETISKEESLKAGEIPVFDLILLGVGEDGHTASLFPGSPLLEKKNGICFSESHPEDGTERITISPAVIQAARRIAFLVKSEGKAEIVRLVLEGNGDLGTYPANIFRSAKGHVTWFIDSSAALRLSPERR